MLKRRALISLLIMIICGAMALPIYGAMTLSSFPMFFYTFQLTGTGATLGQLSLSNSTLNLTNSTALISFTATPNVVTTAVNVVQPNGSNIPAVFNSRNGSNFTYLYTVAGANNGYASINITVTRSNGIRVISNNAGLLYVDNVVPTFYVLQTRPHPLIGVETYSMYINPSETVGTPSVTVALGSTVRNILPVSAGPTWTVTIVPTTGWGAGTATLNVVLTDLVGNSSGTRVLATINIDTIGPSVIETAGLGSFAFGQNALITCNIYDNNNIQDVKLVYRILGTNGQGTEVPMSAHSGSQYSAVIPAADLSPSGLEYYIKARDAVNNIGRNVTTWNIASVISFSAPMISNALITANAGETPVIISAEVADNIGLSGVTLSYRVNGGAEQNFRMSLNGAYYKYEIPAGAVPANGSITYYIKATNISNLTNYYTAIGLTNDLSTAMANPITITLLNQSAPVLAHTPVTSAERAQALSLQANASDPSGLSMVKLWYRNAVTGWQRRQMVANNSLYNGTIDASLVVSGLQYYIEAIDVNNKVTTTNVISVTVIDNQAPVLTHVPQSQGKVGVTLNFSAAAQDNVAGAVIPSLVYRKAGASAWTTINSAPYQISGAYINTLDNIEYYFTATDGANSVSAPNSGYYVIQISSQDGPLISHIPPARITQFKTLTINAVVVGESPVQSADLYWRYADGDWQTISLTNTAGGIYSAVLPGNSLGQIGNLQYYFSATDNANHSEMSASADTPNVVAIEADRELPQLTITEPYVSVTSLATQNISGVALDNVEASTINAYLNGSLVAGRALHINGAFSIGNVILRDGSNRIEVVAQDPAGNRVTASTMIELGDLRVYNAEAGVSINLATYNARTNAPISITQLTTANFSSMFGLTVDQSTPGGLVMDTLAEITVQDETVATGTVFNNDGILISMRVPAGTATANLTPCWWNIDKGPDGGWDTEGLSWTGLHASTGQQLGLHNDIYYFASTHLSLFTLVSSIDHERPAVVLSGAVDNGRYALGNTLNILLSATDNIAVGGWAYRLDIVNSVNVIVTSNSVNTPELLLNLIPLSAEGRYELIVTVSDTAIPANITTLNLAFSIVDLGDQTRPQIAIDSPAIGAAIVAGQIVNISGTVRDNVSMNYYTVEWRYDIFDTWKGITTVNSTMIISNILAVLDTTGTGITTNWLIRVVAVDSSGNTANAVVGYDLTAPTINSLRITNSRALSGTAWVKNGDSLIITANIVDDHSISIARIKADLNSFGLGGSVVPNTFVNNVASWTIASADVLIAGRVTVTVTVDDNAGNQRVLAQAITADNAAPIISGFFVNNAIIAAGDALPFNREIVAVATDNYGIRLINMALKQNSAVVGGLFTTAAGDRATL
ncbi:MAG: hypothetical protein WC838_02740, partial [Candidatus Margulisiibacteriota bacterium]